MNRMVLVIVSLMIGVTLMAYWPNSADPKPSLNFSSVISDTQASVNSPEDHTHRFRVQSEENGTKIMGATRLIVSQARTIVAEALTFTRNAINLAFSVAIDSL